MNFDFRDLVGRFANALNVSVARERPPTYDGGLAMAGGWELFTLAQAFIVPIRQQLDPDATGGRLVGEIRIFVDVDINTGYERPARGDVLWWQGHSYRVIDVKDWRSGSGLLELIAGRQDIDESSLAAWVAVEGGHVQE